ncbi:MAG: SpoIIE family protein phosphatase, partial [Bacteroidetes bacterium]|nr:SpoIIE family protein phosphatase [Bacteroidota bacterium]
AILPPVKLVKEYLNESFILYKPKDIVAGDFYWIAPIDETKAVQTNSTKIDHRILFAAADCTGHGVPGAMVSVVCSNALNRAVKEFGITNPAQILDKVRELVIETFEKSESEVKDGMDISLVLLNTSTYEVAWAGANNPLWIISENELQEIKPDKQPIGKYAAIKPFTSHSIQLKKNQCLYIFTDGFVDQFGGTQGKKFKTTNFKKLLISIQDQSMDKQKEILNSAFENWKGHLEQVDDVCVIGVRI